MQQFLIYSVKVAAVLAVFYMFYRLLLSRESLHRLNRVVLLAIAVLSFVLPAGFVTMHKTVTVAPETTNQVLKALDIAEAAVGYSTAEVAAGAPATIDTANWRRILLTAALALYLLGAAFMLWRLLASLYGIRRVIRNGRRIPQDDGTTIVVTDSGATPSSWMHYIFLSPEDAVSPEPSIIRHERAHIALRHSWDLLLVDIVKAVQWFNPAIWMLRRDLSVVHEYEADKAVLDAGADARA
ncbi:MAG: M56 family peptidase, partial [Bacteroidales bacterium]|nr:M56 family peptidase [Bacteroidales bacterium]